MCEVPTPPGDDDRHPALSEVSPTCASDGPGAADALFPLVYAELRAIAGALFRGPKATLQPTAVVHEAYLKLVRDPGQWRGREHFLALAARAMRQVLVDAVRSKRTDKRGAGWQRVSLGGSATDLQDPSLPTLGDLDSALVELELRSERQARVVELRYFGGLSVPEAARVLDVSERTVKSDWRFARAWLRAELGGGV